MIATHVQRAHARLRHTHMETMFGPSLVARHMASAGFHDPSIVAVPLTLDMMPFVPKKIEAAALSMQTWALKESRKQAVAQALQLSAGTDDEEEAKPAVYASGIIKKRRKKMKKHKYRKRLKKTRALRKALKKI